MRKKKLLIVSAKVAHIPQTAEQITDERTMTNVKQYVLKRMIRGARRIIFKKIDTGERNEIQSITYK